MRFRDGGTVSVALIARPHDFDERCQKPHVQELRKSLRDVFINPLLVRAKVDGGYEVICGRDRLAASHLAGLLGIPVRIVDGATPEDLRRLELAENVFRRNLATDERVRQLREWLTGRADEIVVERKAPDASANAWAQRFERERVVREADPAWQARAAAMEASEAPSPVASQPGEAPELPLTATVDDAAQELRTSVQSSPAAGSITTGAKCHTTTLLSYPHR
jgi:hypothetical protein